MVDERELYSSKWFEYRPYDPDTATLIFLKAWARRMLLYNGKLGKFPIVLRDYTSFDRRKLSRMKRYKTLTGLRQWCDQHGMPYEKFWEWACESHLELKLGKIREIYFTNEKLLAEVKAAWDQHKRNFIVVTDAWILHPDAYRGYDCQDAYYTYVLEEIARRNHPATLSKVIKRFVMEEKISPCFLQKRLVSTE